MGFDEDKEELWWNLLMLPRRGERMKVQLNPVLAFLPKLVGSVGMKTISVGK